ncbi:MULTISPECIES: hypothetical protein [unclassified Luteococcus]|uniref:hypothetical protein n=1 Tax=unclassified Luteococcus TaxID=2639923 RepID=UPI00313EAD54
MTQHQDLDQAMREANPTHIQGIVLVGAMTASMMFAMVVGGLWAEGAPELRVHYSALWGPAAGIGALVGLVKLPVRWMMRHPFALMIGLLVALAAIVALAVVYWGPHFWMSRSAATLATAALGAATALGFVRCAADPRPSDTKDVTQHFTHLAVITPIAVIISFLTGLHG